MMVILDLNGLCKTGFKSKDSPCATTEAAYMLKHQHDGSMEKIP